MWGQFSCLKSTLRLMCSGFAATPFSPAPGPGWWCAPAPSSPAGQLEQPGLISHEPSLAILQTRSKNENIIKFNVFVHLYSILQCKKWNICINVLVMNDTGISWKDFCSTLQSFSRSAITSSLMRSPWCLLGLAAVLSHYCRPSSWTSRLWSGSPCDFTTL